MERWETIFHRMTVAFPLQLEKGSKALRFEVGVRRSLPTGYGFLNFKLRTLVAAFAKTWPYVAAFAKTWPYVAAFAKTWPIYGNTSA